MQVRIYLAGRPVTLQPEWVSSPTVPLEPAWTSADPDGLHALGSCSSFHAPFHERLPALEQRQRDLARPVNVGVGGVVVAGCGRLRPQWHVRDRAAAGA